MILLLYSSLYTLHATHAAAALVSGRFLSIKISPRENEGRRDGKKSARVSFRLEIDDREISPASVSIGNDEIYTAKK